MAQRGAASGQGRSSRIFTQSEGQLQPPPWAWEDFSHADQAEGLTRPCSLGIALKVLEGPKCDGERCPATALGDVNLDMQPHTGPPRALVGLFGFVASSSCEAASSLESVWPTEEGTALAMSIYYT